VATGATGSANVTVGPAGIDHFTVTAPSSASSGVAFSVGVAAFDAFGNAKSNYTGIVHFSSTDGAATLPADYTFVLGDAGSHLFSNAVTLQTAGSQTVSVNDTVTTSATGTSGTITVSSPTSTTTITRDGGGGTSSTYGDALSFTATVTGAGPAPTGSIQWAVDGTDSGSPVPLVGGQAGLSLTGTALSATGHSIKATYLPATYYLTSFDTWSQTVDKAGSTTTVDCSGTFTYDGAAHGCTATWTSTGADGNGGAASVDTYAGRNTTSYGPSASAPTGAGDYTANGSFGGDTNHTGSNDSADFSIGLRRLDITATDQAKTYGETFTFAGTEFTTGANQLVTGDSVTTVTLMSAGAAATATVAGSPYSITPSVALGAGLANYDIHYHLAPTGLALGLRDLDITATDQTKTYGATFLFAGTEFSTGPGQVVNTDGVTSVSLTSAGAPGTASVVGSPYAITPSDAVGSGLANYDIHYHDAPTGLTVGPATLTFDAVASSKTYGDAEPTLTATLSGFKNGETDAGLRLLGDLTGSASCSRVAGETVASSPYAISCTQGSLLATNYVFAEGSGAAFTIDARPLTITADDRTKTYGDVLVLGTGAFTTDGNEASGEHVTAVTLTSNPDKAGDTFATVGTYSDNIAPSGATGTGGFEAANYDIDYVAGELTIGPATLSVDAVASSKTYGDPDPAFTATLSGFRNLETDAGLRGTSDLTGSASCGRVSGETVAGSPYAITCTQGTLAATNYVFATGDPADFDILKAGSAVTVTCSGDPYTYDASAHGCSATWASTGADGEHGPASVDTYAGRNATSYGPSATAPINAGDYTASGSFAGDANHTGNTGTKDFTIQKASSTTVVTCPTVPVAQNAPAMTPCTVDVSGAGGLHLTPDPVYANNTSASPPLASASYTYGGDANHTGSNDSKTFSIVAGTPSTLQFTAGPGNTGANQQINPSGGITVAIQDAYGNTETTDGTTKITLSLSTNPGGGVLSCPSMTVMVGAGVGTFAGCWIDEVANGYKLGATDTTGGAGHPLTAATSSPFNIMTSALLTDIVNMDPDLLNAMDGFDVLFTKGSGTSQRLQATNPGTFHYRLGIRNETGLYLHQRNVPINGANGGSLDVVLTIPGLPGNLGTGITLPAGVQGGPAPAFVISGSHGVHVHPYEDESVELNATIQWASLAQTAGGAGDCSTVTTWQTGQPGDNAVVKCLKVSDMSIPKHGRARIDVSLEFRWKGTDGWASTASTAFHAGFAFRSHTTITLDPGSLLGSQAGTNLVGDQVVGLVGAGEKITGIGGFVFDENAAPAAGTQVKLFASATGASCAATPVAQDTTTSDGFYFIWDAGTDQSLTTNTLPSGAQYYVVLCNVATGADGLLPAVNWPSRSMDHKLGNKEFDEEDFYVSPSTQLTVIQQPSNGRVNQVLPTVRVAVQDFFGGTVIKDNSTKVTLTLGHAPAGAILSGTGVVGGQVTVTVVNGVATFSGLKVSKTGSGYTFTASSTPFYTGAETMTFTVGN
jgi:hypothetical protein